MKSLKHISLAAWLGCAAVVSPVFAQEKPASPDKASAAKAAPSEKVLYHITDSDIIFPSLNNMNNHLKAAPNAKIVAVVHGPAIDMLVKRGSIRETYDKLRWGATAQEKIAGLQQKGVVFEACGNTMTRLNISPQELLPGVQIVTAGLPEVVRLQSQEGFVYLKP